MAGMRIASAALVAWLVGQPSAAVARDYYYFNKPHVGRAAYVADRLECLELSGGARIPDGSRTIYVPQYSNLSAGQNALAVGLAALFAGLMSGGEQRRLGWSIERTCMADKGYLRYRVEKSVVRDIEKLKDENARVERYFSLAATAQPMGEKIRE